MPLTPMDYMRGIIAQAIAEGMSLADLQHCAEYATTPEDFDIAVNMLAGMKPQPNDQTTT